MFQICDKKDFEMFLISKHDCNFRSDYAVQDREDKTIESAVPFPAPEKGDNQGLSPFHPRIIIVVGECPLLSPV